MTPAIVGTGFAVPPQVRLNSDPIFAALRDQPSLFTGFVERRVLGPGETVTWLMVEAARAALMNANVTPAAVDLVLGYGSVGQYISPNTLAQVHAELGLGADVTVLPFADDFTNFNSALWVADGLLRAGHAATALIVCGDNWTQYVDYATPQAISAGDGAAAAVVADGAGWTLVDRERLTVSANYGEMFMAADHVGGAWTAPFIHITPLGMQEFVTFGMGRAPQILETLLTRNDLAASDVTVISHQASGKLIGAWQVALPSATFLNTLTEYGNVVLAAIPLTLAAAGDQIKTDHLILFGLGVQMQASALLLTRQPSTSAALAEAPQAA